MDHETFLKALLEATKHWERDPRHDAWDGAFLVFTRAAGLKPPLLGQAAALNVRATDVDDLADQGLVRLLPARGGGIERKFALTAEGRRRAEVLGIRPQDPDAVDLSWPTLRSRLSAFVDAYERAGTPAQGLPLDEHRGDALHLRILVQTGYLEETEFGVDQQAMLRPTERALAVTRGWPSAESAAREVVHGLMERLAERSDPEARSLHRALTETGRELLVEVTAAVLARQSGLG